MSKPKNHSTTTTPLSVQVSAETKWWFMPAVLAVKYWHKLIRKEPSDSVIDFLVNNALKVKLTQPEAKKS